MQSDLYEETSLPARSRLQVRDHLASLQAKWYEIEEVMKTLSEEDAELVAKRWIGNLACFEGEAQQTAVRDLLADIPEGLQGGSESKQKRKALQELSQGEALQRGLVRQVRQQQEAEERRQRLLWAGKSGVSKPVNELSFELYDSEEAEG